MNVYVWQRVQQASQNYHSEGGVVVFADSVEEARALALAADSGCVIAAGEQPDEVRACTDGEKRVFIMPDAGCC